MKKLIAGVVVILIIISLILLIGKKPETNMEEKPTVRIGVIYPLSGTFSELSNAHKQAFKFVLEDMENKKLKYNYELIFEDNQFDNKKTAMIANKMIKLNKVDAIFSIDSDSGNVLNSVLEDKDIFMSGWMSDKKIADRYLSFPYGGYIKGEAQMLVEKLKELNINNVNLFITNDSFHGYVEEALEEILSKNDIEYTTFNFNAREKDFRMMISKSKNTGAQMNFIGAYSPDIDILARQLKELKVNLPMTSLEDFAYAEEMELFKGQWFVVPSIVTNEKFLDRVEEKLGSRNTHYMELLYEVFKRFIESCEKTKPTSSGLDVKAMARKFLRSNYIDSDLSGKFTIRSNGFISTPFVLGVVRNGKIEPLE